MQKIYRRLWLIMAVIFILTACGALGATASEPVQGKKVQADGGAELQDPSEVPSSSGQALRDPVARVLVPSADMANAQVCDVAAVDATHADQGYISVSYFGDNPKVKIQIITPTDVTYTYLLRIRKDEFEAFPLTGGNGTYILKVYENLSGNRYVTAMTAQVDVVLKDEFLPYLYANQYVYFNHDSDAVAKAQELAADCYTDLDVVAGVYHYVVNNISYDYEKLKTVKYGYLPDIDETLHTGKGICFDYAALMSAMLRMERIPTKLEVGYVGDVYHAWISTWIEDIGWVDNIIRFDGKNWTLMDPTFASTQGADQAAVGDGSSYMLKYSY